MKKTPWTEEQKALLRERYGKVPTAELALLVGHTPHQTLSKANAMKLSYGWRPRLDGRHDGTIRELNARGYPDAEIARLLPDCDRKAITRRRLLLGLPSQARSERYRAKVREATRRQCAAAGAPNLACVRAAAYADFARLSGWPGDLRPRATMILNLLTASGVPMTRRQIAQGVGMPWKGTRNSLTSNDPEGSYLAHLAARGLVLRLVRAHQVLGRGKSQSVDLYTLGPAALAILAGRAGRTHQGEVPCPNPERTSH